MSTYVIGDIHNCYRELAKLLYEVIDIQPEDELYFVGDLFDRGDKADEMFYWLKRNISNPQFHFCMGNHDDMMLQVLKRDEGYHNIYGRVDDDWFYNGAINTCISWEDAGVTPEEMDLVFAEYDKKLQLKFTVERDDKIFHIVHAGLPGPDSWYPRDDYTWSRKEFYFGDYPEFAANEFIIFGHTPTRFVWQDVDNYIEVPAKKEFLERIGFPLQYVEDRNREQYVLEFNHRIMIDTGCVYHGWLTAYRLEDGKIFQVKSKQ